MKQSRIQRSKTALLVVDIQEKLLPAIFQKERVVQNSARLIKGAQVLNVPVFVTEQYRKGLGATVPEIASEVAIFTPIEKLAFSCCGAPGLLPAFTDRCIADVILCGIEAHVCVSQTCLDLLQHGLRPFIVADAVSSRAAADNELGLQRMRDAGAVIVSTEMILFELLEKAGTYEFKKMLSLLK